MTVDQVPVTIVSGDDRDAIARAAQRVCEAIGDRRVAAVGPDLPAGPWDIRVDLEPRITYRTPGCLCCAYRGDLVDELGELSVGDGRPEWIIVLESPGADPLLAVQTFLGGQTLLGHVLLDGLVVATDARALSARLSVAKELGADGTDGGPVVAVWSSTIVLDGLELLTPGGEGMVIRALRNAAPLANVAQGGSLAMAVGRRLLDPGFTNDLVGEAFRRGGPVLEFRTGLDPGRAYGALQALLDAHPGQIPMVLGSLSFVGMPGRLVVHGARAYVANGWLHDGSVSGLSRLLVVGDGIDRAALRREIALVHS